MLIKIIVGILHVVIVVVGEKCEALGPVKEPELARFSPVILGLIVKSQRFKTVKT